MENDELKSEEMGAEFMPSFVSDEKKDSNTLTRQELKDNYTVKELAKLAEPKSKTYSYNSLKSRSKDFLIDIILEVNKEEETKINQAKATHKTSTNASEDLVSMGLGILNAFKKQREGENAELNPIATELFKNSAVNEVDKARADGTLQTDKFNTALLAISGTALVVDGVIGFKNVPTLFSKLKAKFKKDDTK